VFHYRNKLPRTPPSPFDHTAERAVPTTFKSGSTRAEQISSATAALQNSMDAIGAIAAIVNTMLLLGTLASARIIHRRTFSSTTLTLALHVFGWIGIVFIAVGAYVQVCIILELAPLFCSTVRVNCIVLQVQPIRSLYAVVALVLTTGFLKLVTAVIGFVGVFKKNVIALAVGLFLFACCMALQVRRSVV
jgi:hypothetical protein